MPMPGHSLVPYPLDQSRSRKKLLFFSGRQSSQSGEGSPPKRTGEANLFIMKSSISKVSIKDRLCWASSASKSKASGFGAAKMEYNNCY